MSRSAGIGPIRTAPGRPRLAFHEEGNGYGGPGRSVLAIARAIDPEEFEVHLFGYPGGPYENEDLPVVFHPLRESSPSPRPVPSGTASDDALYSAEGATSPKPSRKSCRVLLPKHLAMTIRAALKTRGLARVLNRSGKFKLFHANSAGAEEAPIAGRLAEISSVLGTFHTDPTYDLEGQRRDWWYRSLEHTSNHALTRAIAVSRSAAELWSRRTHLPMDRIEIIHNGIDPQRFQRSSDGLTARRRLAIPGDDPTSSLLVGTMGRLAREKGHDLLIQALARLVRDPSMPELRLVIAGRGPLENELLRLAERLGVESRVTLLGFHADVQPVLDALDLFVMPSRAETLGYALLEAMASELPAVGTRVGGIPEVVQHGRTGLLVAPEDPDALAQAIALLVHDPERRRRMGCEGRQRVVADFSEETMVSRTIDLYRRFASAPPR